MNLTDFAPNTAVITTTHVVKNGSLIEYVSYDEDGDFQMFSEEGADMERAAVVSLESLLKLDPSLAELKNLEKGDEFYRETKAQPWVKIAS